VKALDSIAYSENLEVGKHVLRGAAGEIGEMHDCDLRIYIYSTAEIGDEPWLPLRGEMLGSCHWEKKADLIVKEGRLGDYGDRDTVTPMEVASAARRWRMKHFWRYLL
jgi:hypothetical protein